MLVDNCPYSRSCTFVPSWIIFSSLDAYSPFSSPRRTKCLDDLYEVSIWIIFVVAPAEIFAWDEKTLTISPREVDPTPTISFSVANDTVVV